MRLYRMWSSYRRNRWGSRARGGTQHTHAHTTPKKRNKNRQRQSSCGEMDETKAMISTTKDFLCCLVLWGLAAATSVVERARSSATKAKVKINKDLTGSGAQRTTNESGWWVLMANRSAMAAAPLLHVDNATVQKCKRPGEERESKSPQCFSVNELRPTT